MENNIKTDVTGEVKKPMDKLKIKYFIFKLYLKGAAVAQEVEHVAL